MSIKLAAEINNSLYEKRINRTMPFLGVDEVEQKIAQEKLAGSTIGIAGAGGIGGAMAVRLARFGVKKIKIADPDTFDYSNINRQLGANIPNIGKNKAQVVAEMAFDIGQDVEIEVFTDGITRENASEFVSGCDLVLDQVDFSLIGEKYALHRAFRNEPKCRCILACSVIGWSAHLYKFTKDSLPIEEWYGIEDETSIASLADEISKTEKLLNLWSPRFPLFPSKESLLKWISDNDTLPIFAGSPPVAEGLLTQRAILCLIDKEHPPYAATLPPIPNIYIYDAAQLSGSVYFSDGEIKNKLEIENFNNLNK
ncbi:ThiF family adenylyltransferase [Xenorhabdus bovienii]|uniref:UBA/THIF-type NAD/FAD binding fold protein n=1 Tax=Xenorhabdus bovienii str. kraussei Becker Underwood TaxID=1398204 RepID=A0A077PMR5_XENBV|nr:ThiF family adenylyltransferase [Xenorhabdus bovienii]CDH22368.1 UBA/THIF-type NAD/FAD binding fold protein [Xenorhabdus bovienii str. kraussei Becker Underwood]